MKTRIQQYMAKGLLFTGLLQGCYSPNMDIPTTSNPASPPAMHSQVAATEPYGNSLPHVEAAWASPCLLPEPLAQVPTGSGRRAQDSPTWPGQVGAQAYAAHAKGLWQAMTTGQLSALARTTVFPNICVMPSAISQSEVLIHVEEAGALELTNMRNLLKLVDALPREVLGFQQLRLQLHLLNEWLVVSEQEVVSPKVLAALESEFQLGQNLST
ncbi:MAG: hypothetical protein AAFU83_00430, partial [Bacteroidota bacterium]